MRIEYVMKFGLILVIGLCLSSFGYADELVSSGPSSAPVIRERVPLPVAEQIAVEGQQPTDDQKAALAVMNQDPPKDPPASEDPPSTSGPTVGPVVVTDPGNNAALVSAAISAVGEAFIGFPGNFSNFMQQQALTVLHENELTMTEVLVATADGPVSIEVGPGVGENDLLISVTTTDADGNTVTVLIDVYPTSPGFGLPNTGADVQVTITTDQGEEGGETITLTFENVGDALEYLKEHYGQEDAEEEGEE